MKFNLLPGGKLSAKQQTPTNTTHNAVHMISKLQSSALLLHMNIVSALKVCVSTTSGLLDYTPGNKSKLDAAAASACCCCCNHERIAAQFSLSVEFAKPDLPEWLGPLPLSLG
jgi:hypothetical protein